MSNTIKVNEALDTLYRDGYLTNELKVSEKFYKELLEEMVLDRKRDHPYLGTVYEDCISLITDFGIIRITKDKQL